MRPLDDALAAHTSLAILGMGKNAGKTTVLNFLLSRLAKGPKTVAVTSIGRDGESVDVVTGTSKPGIWVKRGSLIVTATGLLNACDITREIVDATGIHTPLGEVVVMRALSDGNVQLAGPSVSGQLIPLIEKLRDFGAGVVLVDGAISRKAFGSPTVCEAVILCAGASGHPDMEVVVRETAYICELLLLPESKEDHAHLAIVDGAVTDRVLREMSPKPGDEIRARDSSRFLLSSGLYRQMTARGVRFTVETASVLRCVCVNPFSATGPSYDADIFLRCMREALPVPVVDVKSALL